ncbi:MAG: hypothetical protein EDX89_16085 [Acidobacteria bacterium]|nr:MAG: hypothetical protein EDX89_16085 [Acidobacteriota bacterium]
MGTSPPGAIVASAALVALWAPGFALERLGAASGARRDPVVRLAVATGAGLSALALLVLWATTLGARWGPTSARVVTLAFGVVALAPVVRGRGTVAPPRGPGRARREVTLAVFAVIALLAAATRASHVRELALPAWVDSVHHQMIVQLVVEQGRVPATWAPFLPEVQSVYHWGFHAGAAWTAWLAGARTPHEIARALLVYGQVLNVLFAVVLYAGARVLFRSRAAGLLAAAVGTLVSWFPAYYVAWGRYTQLAGLLVLPVAAIALFRLEKRPEPRAIVLAAILLAGIALVHVLVAFLLAPLLVVLAVPAVRRGGASVLRAWLTAGALSALLVAPWLARLVASGQPREALAPSRRATAASWATYNDFPEDLLLSPGTRELISVATIGLTGMAGWEGMPPAGRALSAGLWLTALAVEGLRRRGRSCRRLPWGALGILWGWSAISLLLVNLDRLGLPPLRAVPNRVLVIAAFLPLSLAAAGVSCWLLRLVEPARSFLPAVALVLGLGVWGASRLVDVVPPWTVLATDRDVRAMEWVERHAPASAVFAVRTRAWESGTFAGVDGGCWLQLLTGRRTILPPSLYVSTPDRARLERLEAFLAAWSASASLEDPLIRGALRDAGVTHLFLGENPGLLAPPALAGRPWTKTVYRDGPVAVFELALDDRIGVPDR